jgi:hypothetical protein
MQRGRDSVRQESLGEIPKHRRKVPKKPFVVEARYIGEKVASFINSDWHKHSAYETLESAQQAVDALNRKDNLRKFGSVAQPWFSYRIRPSITT